MTTGISIDGTRGFARGLWDMLTDGGVWGVPRSGLMYQKDEAGSRFILVARMPWFEGLSCTDVELRESQDFDHAGITTMFALIGVKVVEELLEDDEHEHSIMVNP